MFGIGIVEEHSSTEWVLVPNGSIVQQHTWENLFDNQQQQQQDNTTNLCFEQGLTSVIPSQTTPFEVQVCTTSTLKCTSLQRCGFGMGIRRKISGGSSSK